MKYIKCMKVCSNSNVLLTSDPLIVYKHQTEGCFLLGKGVVLVLYHVTYVSQYFTSLPPGLYTL